MEVCFAKPHEFAGVTSGTHVRQRTTLPFENVKGLPWQASLAVHIVLNQTPMLNAGA